MRTVTRLVLVFSILAATSSAAYSQVTLRLLDTRLSEEPSRSILTAIVTDFMKQNPGIKVQLESVKSADMLTKFLVASEAKQPPDVVYLYAGMLTRTVERGYLLPLDDLVKAEGSGFLPRFYPMAIGAVTSKEKIFAVPTIVSVYGYWVNRDTLKQVGLPEGKPPSTWEVFLEVCRKLTRARSGSAVNQWAFAMVGKTRSAVQRLAPWVFTNDARMMNEEQNVFLPDRDRAKEAFRFLVRERRGQRFI